MCVCMQTGQSIDLYTRANDNRSFRVSVVVTIATGQTAAKHLAINLIHDGFPFFFFAFRTNALKQRSWSSAILWSVMTHRRHCGLVRWILMKTFCWRVSTVTSTAGALTNPHRYPCSSLTASAAVEARGSLNSASVSWVQVTSLLKVPQAWQPDSSTWGKPREGVEMGAQWAPPTGKHLSGWQKGQKWQAVLAFWDWAQKPKYTALVPDSETLPYVLCFSFLKGKIEVNKSTTPLGCETEYKTLGLCMACLKHQALCIMFHVCSCRLLAGTPLNLALGKSRRSL